MPAGPKGQKCPADVIGAAIKVAKVAKIATGKTTEDVAENGKDKAAQSLGGGGGIARAALRG